MNFAAEEYDAGASLHVIQLASQPYQVRAFKMKKEVQSTFKSELNVIKCLGC
jgi:hypothetical protein